MLFSWKSLFHFLCLWIIAGPSLKVVPYKILGKSQATKFIYSKFQAIRQHLIILDFSKHNCWEFLNYEKGIMGWVLCHNMEPAYKTNVMLLLNFFATLRQGWRNLTMWPWAVHILGYSQNRHNVGATFYF